MMDIWDELREDGFTIGPIRRISWGPQEGGWIRYGVNISGMVNSGDYDHVRHKLHYGLGTAYDSLGFTGPDGNPSMYVSWVPEVPEEDLSFIQEERLETIIRRLGE